MLQGRQPLRPPRLTGVWAPVLALALCILLPLQAQAQDAIGRIIRSTGEVNALDASGATRPLARGSAFFAGETIVTAAGANVLLRFSDASVITLEEDTRFQVNDYNFDGAGGSDDTLVMTLLEGTLRTITGAVGTATGDTYQMNTPLASIGIRGTEYGVRVTANGRTFVIVFDGGITLTPAGGGTPVNLGLDANSDAAGVEEDLTVVELDTLPEELQQVIDSIVESIPEAELDALPAPEDAIEAQLQVQLQLQLQEVRDAAGNLTTNLLATADLGGTLVDANGNALDASSPEALANARRQVVLTVNDIDPTLFDDRTKAAVSPN